jgi:hypothetical protein
MISRGQVKFDMLTILNKSATNKGFYTDDRLNMGIREAFSAISTECFLAGEGWLNNIRCLTTASGMVSLDIPSDIAFIDQVRYLVGNDYLPMRYDTMKEQAQVQPGTGTNYAPASYRILNNAFWFNPALSEGGTDYLQIEYTSFPKRLQNDQDFLPQGQFSQAMYWFLVYRACTVCVQTVGKAVPEWSDKEGYWYDRMVQVISKRNKQVTYVRDFDG